MFIIAPILGVLCLFNVRLCIFISSLVGIRLDMVRRVVCFTLFVFWCPVIVFVPWRFLTAPIDDLQCGIVVFPDHIHLLFSPRPVVI